MKQKHIAILDFGSQYMHLISRRIRQLGVLAKIYPTDVNAHELADAWGVIISGGPNSVNDQKLPYDPGLFNLDIPILGLCYGHQLMAHHYGGVVTPAHNREYGLATIQITEHNDLFSRLGDQEQVWMSHWDSVTAVPDGFTVTAMTNDCPVAAMANDTERRYGLQFHPEVHHTTNGMKILENFVFEICGAETNWSMEEYIEQLQQEVRETVGDRNVFLLVSGGVDSSVAYALLEKVLGKDRVFGLHIDNGFMRHNESAMVKEALADAGFDNLHAVDASSRFLMAVDGVCDPEEKRQRIGRIFLDVQRDVFADLKFNPNEWVLGQGTIYPDTIETGGTRASDKIKTHHNRVDEMLELINQGKVVEPLAALYKDEVRELGRTLRLPEHLLNRWPFPGPGLSIRCLCADGTETVQDEGAINEKLEYVSRPAGVHSRVLPVCSVGVQGDQRSYQHPAVITGAPSTDWESVGELSVRITNDVTGINRVVLHVGGDVAFDAARMQVKPATLTKERLDVLRQADAIVDAIVAKYNLYSEIWQFPVILLPLSFSPSRRVHRGKNTKESDGIGEGGAIRDGGETIVLRPIESQEAMTVNFYPMDAAVLDEMVQQLLALPGIDAVFYDVTNKPPATIEWE